MDTKQPDIWINDSRGFECRWCNEPIQYIDEVWSHLHSGSIHCDFLSRNKDPIYEIAEPLKRKTSSWQDVRNKAVRMKNSGRVHIIVVESDLIEADVDGDHAKYHVELHYRVHGFPNKISDWSCTCNWNTYVWGRAPKYRKFEGRLCSHAYATYLQARGERSKLKKSASYPTNLDKLKTWMVENHPDVTMHTDHDDFGVDADNHKVTEWMPKAYLHAWGSKDGPGQVIDNDGQKSTPFNIYVKWNRNIHSRDHATMVALHEIGHVLQAKEDWGDFWSHNVYNNPHADSDYERDAFEKGVQVAKQIGMRITPEMRNAWNSAVGGEHLSPQYMNKTSRSNIHPVLEIRMQSGRNMRLNVEIVDNVQSISQGLMNRSFLSQNEGMVFLHPNPPSYGGF